MPFLAICPECHYSQVCVLPRHVFPRMKCCRCREIYDPIGTEDTEVIPALAGSTIARLVLERRSNRAEVRAARERKRRKRRRRTRKLVAAGAVAGPPSAEQIAAAVLSEPLLVAAAGPPADETTPQVVDEATAPATSPKPAVLPSQPPKPRPIRKRSRRRTPSMTAGAIPLAAGGIFLLGVAVAAAGFGPTAFLVRPLAAVSLLVGIWGTCVGIREGEGRRYPLSVALCATLVVAISFLVPGFLGETFDTAVTGRQSDAQVEVIPHPKYASDTGLVKDGWIDASRASARVGTARIEIVNIWKDRGPAGWRPAGWADPAGAFLYLRVRLHRLKTEAGAENRALSSEPHWTEASFVLSDPGGNRLALQPRIPWDGRGGAALVVPNMALDTFESNLIFGPPAPGVNLLRAEINAAAWGGTGVVRFEIPGSMIGPRPPY